MWITWTISILQRPILGVLCSRACGEEEEDVRLGEQLPDLSVNVAEEIHVGGSTVQTLILHQKLTEQHLHFVFLPHDLQLQRDKKSFKTFLEQIFL